MRKIGVLIPEFPLQTHAFFIREQKELKSLGVDAKIISTRKPSDNNGIAQHDWVAEMTDKTEFLFPVKPGEYVKLFFILLFSGPKSFFRILSAIHISDLGMNEKIKQIPLILLGAKIKYLASRFALDHIHVHSCANAANIALYSRLLGGPTYSLTLHGALGDYGSNQSNKWKHALFGISITQELLASIKENIAHEQLPPLFIAPMGVDVNYFKREKKYTLPDQSKLIKIVSCGRLNRMKGYDDLIKAVGSLKAKKLQVQLNICGALDGSGSKQGYLDELKTLCKELDVEKNVHFLGSVSEKTVISELEDAHFFCLATRKEALGVAIMEAMALETPVIVCKTQGIMELVSHNEDGILVEPYSSEQFVSSIMNLLVSPKKIADLTKKARKKIVNDFHSGKSASIIEKNI